MDDNLASVIADIAIETAKASTRALRAENAALKADVAELVEALRCSLVLVGSRFHASWDFDETILMARSMLAKHAAAQPPAYVVNEFLGMAGGDTPQPPKINICPVCKYEADSSVWASHRCPSCLNAYPQPPAPEQAQAEDVCEWETSCGLLT